MTEYNRHNPDCGKVHLTNIQMFQQMIYQKTEGGGEGEGRRDLRDTSTNCKE